jgi:hypothetical protein
MKARKQRTAGVDEVAGNAAHRSLTMARKLDQVECRSVGCERGRQGGQ